MGISEPRDRLYPVRLQTMKAARIHQLGSPDVIAVESIRVPEPGDEDVRVRVHAAGVGPWDALVRTGKIPQALPLTLGSEFSGVIEKIGAKTTGFAVGDEVFGATNSLFIDGYAEYAVAAARMIAPKPAHASGLRVIASVHGNGAEYVRSLGADEVIDTASQDFQAQGFVKFVQCANAVIDTVGGKMQHQLFPLVKPGGVIVSAVVRPDPQRAAECRVRPDYLIVDVNSVQLARLADMLRRKELQTSVGSVLPLAEARAAHQML